MVPNAGNAQTVYDAVAERTADMDVTVENATDQLSLLGIQGPKAAQVVSGLGEAFAEAADSLKNYRVTEISVDGSDWIEARTGYTGADGFEIMTPNEHGRGLWDQACVLDIAGESTCCGLDSH